MSGFHEMISRYFSFVIDKLARAGTERRLAFILVPASPAMFSILANLFAFLATPPRRRARADARGSMNVASV
jgi:hypothetical protein